MKIVETRRKPVKIDENLMKIVGNPLQIVENQWKSLKNPDSHHTHERRVHANDLQRYQLLASESKL